MVDSGMILIKYWLDVGPDEQRRRLKGGIDDPRNVAEAAEARQLP